MIKKIIATTCTIFIVIALVISLPVSAHPGNTDSNGGHYDHSTGSYHYHHGYSAHQHPNGKCPYNSNTSDSNRSAWVNVLIALGIAFGPVLVACIWAIIHKKKSKHAKQSKQKSNENLTNITIKNGATCIPDSDFSGCTSLTSIIIPDSVTSIGSHAFAECTSLTSVNIPNSVTSIGDNAFSGCTSLTSINIPDSVTFIGDYAFDSCTSLKSITIPNSVTYIGRNYYGHGFYTFSDCSSLLTILFNGTIEEWEEMVVRNAHVGHRVIVVCSDGHSYIE